MNEVATQQDTFSLAPRNMAEAMEFAKVIASSDMVPKHYINKPGNVLVAVQMGAELGLKPMQALQGIAVVNGNPTIWGDAMWALILSHPEYEDSTQDMTDTKCTVMLKRKNKSAVVSTFTMDDAKKAGLAGKQGPWQTAPKRMLQMRARAFACRDLFADALRGIKSTEEVRDYEELPERDMGVAEVMPKANIKPELEFCTDEKFASNAVAWRDVVESGRKSVENMIIFLESKVRLTDEQKKRIQSWAKSPVAETSETNDFTDGLDASGDYTKKQ